jgi:hypothetical protein
MRLILANRAIAAAAILLGPISLLIIETQIVIRRT